MAESEGYDDEPFAVDFVEEQRLDRKLIKPLPQITSVPGSARTFDIAKGGGRGPRRETETLVTAAASKDGPLRCQFFTLPSFMYLC